MCWTCSCPSPYADWKAYFRPLEDAYYALQDTEENLELVCARHIRAHWSEFVVHPTDARAAVPPPPVRRVAHPRFGAGTIVAERDPAGTKLDIAFDDGVTRTLLRRFVTDV